MKEIILQNLVFIITGIGIALLGILIQQLRLYGMIAGYNTKSAEERNKVNIEQVAIAIRNAFILMGLIWIIVPVSGDSLGFYKLKFWLLIGLHFVIIATLLIIINTGSKYKINT